MKWTTKPDGKRRREAKAQTLGQALNTPSATLRTRSLPGDEYLDLGACAETSPIYHAVCFLQAQFTSFMCLRKTGAGRCSLFAHIDIQARSAP